MDVEFIAVCGELKYLVSATKMNHGSIQLDIIKPKFEKDGSYSLNMRMGRWCLGDVIDYTGIGWTVCFQHDYFVFDLYKVRSKVFFGDCLTLDDKQAILDQLEDFGMIKI
ncbi:hypothetical protein [Pedobacter metabolipauper]|uniref:Uncharacterized protein n=1 Tax=Pedobacter metabolipauper TaxID=425513 RepID=A0A4R6T157_9SPHI|nr:hypothetical protein [Pedobacter metabolipauper]TDQ12182.1 hypothetical protein ATK78_1316 [Pedobacter metabolipauper]